VTLHGQRGERHFCAIRLEFSLTFPYGPKRIVLQEGWSMFAAAMSLSVLLTFIPPAASVNLPPSWRWIKVTPMIPLADWTRQRELVSRVKAGMTEDEVWALLGPPNVCACGSLWNRMYYYDELGVTVCFLSPECSGMVVTEVDVEPLPCPRAPFVSTISPLPSLFPPDIREISNTSPAR
jgi:hypothetical protein